MSDSETGEIMRINWLGVLISAIVVFLLHYLWVAHFGGADWGHFVAKAINNITADKKAAGLELGSALVLSAVLGWVIGRLRDRSVISGLLTGVVAAIGFAVTTIAPEYIFAGATLKAFLTDSASFVLAYAIGGAILGAMASK